MARVNLGKVVPEKGVDYFTEADKTELKEEIKQEIDAQGMAQAITELQLGSGHSIELELNSETYQLTLTLKNAAGNVLGTPQTIDLPNENAVTGIEYSNGNLVLTKQSGSTSQVDISGLIEGLVTETNFNTFTQELEQTLQGINETIGAINVKNLAQDEAIEENYKVITKLQEEVDDLTQQVEDLEDNQRTNTASGTEIYISDSAKAKVRSIGITGRSTQEERRGYNIFPSAVAQTVQNKGLTIECDGKGRYNVSGTPTDNVAFDFELPEQVTLPISAGQGGKGKMYLFNDFTGGTINFLTPGKSTIDSWGLSSLNRTLSAYSTMGGKVCKYIRIYGSPNVAMNGTLSPMFTNEGDTNREFQEYNGQAVIPISPDNVTPIKNTGDNGSINEKIQTRNWFDVSKISQLIKNGTTTSNGITNIDNVITINKTNGQHGSYAMNYLMPIKSGKITVSFKALLSGTNSNTGILVALYNSTATIYATTAQTKYASSKDKWLDYNATFELNQEAIDGIHLDIQAANTGNVIQIKDIQVELGSTATPYVPHEEQTLSFPLAKNIHFYKDAYFEKENNKWYVVNFYEYFEYPEISKMDRFTIRDKTTLVSFIDLNMNLQLKTYNYNCMSNCFIARDVYNTDQVGVMVHATNKGYSEYVYFGIPNELDLTTKQKAYDWLKENVTLLYPLEVPEKVEITDTTLINQLENLKNVKTYKGGTHIYSSNETPATVDIEYVVDVNAYIDNELENIKNAIISLGGNV